jgi:hypothetical protein
MAKRCIVGLRVKNRVEHVPELQRVLTECGCNIRMRLGLHDTGADFCSPDGLILLDLYGDDCSCSDIRMRLSAIEGVEVQTMEFDV